MNLSGLFLPALCSLCRTTLEMTGNQGLIKGFLASILLLAGVPLLIAGIVLLVFYSHRRSRSC